MNDSKTVLTDTEQRIWLETFHLEGGEADGSWSIDKWTIRGGPGDGIDVIDIDGGVREGHFNLVHRVDEQTYVGLQIHVLDADVRTRVQRFLPAPPEEAAREQPRQVDVDEEIIHLHVERQVAI